MKELLEYLFAITISLSGLLGDKLPEVSPISETELIKTFCAGENESCRGLIAIYIPSTKHIYYRDIGTSL